MPTSARALKDSLVSLDLDVGSDFIRQEAKSWTPPAWPRTMKALGDFGDVRSFYKYVNRYFTGTKDSVSTDTQNDLFPFEEPIAQKARCPANFCYTYSMLPSCAEKFHQLICSHALFQYSFVVMLKSGPTPSYAVNTPST